MWTRCVSCGWVDNAIPLVIEVFDIDETPTLMSFSQLILRFTCKWILKGYWLRLPSACTYHANVMLSDTTHRQKFPRWATWILMEGDMTAWSLIDCTASHYQQNKVLITLPYIYCGCAHLLIMKQTSII